MNIGNQFFATYAEYEAAYIKKWYQLHKTIHPDLNWLKNDWDYRMSHQSK